MMMKITYPFDDDNDNNINDSNTNDNSINNNNINDNNNDLNNNNNDNNNDNEIYDLKNPYWTSDDNYNFATSSNVIIQDADTVKNIMQVDYNNYNNKNINKTSYNIATTSNITALADMPTTSNIMQLDYNNSYATSSVNVVPINDTTADYIMQTDSIDNFNYNSEATSSVNLVTINYGNVTYDNDIMLADINMSGNNFPSP